MNQALIAACKEVLRFHPEVSHLFISVDARWLFCDECFESPTFEKGTVDITLLEDMILSLEDNHTFPLAFYIPEVLK